MLPQNGCRTTHGRLPELLTFDDGVVTPLSHHGSLMDRAGGKRIIGCQEQPIDWMTMSTSAAPIAPPSDTGEYTHRQILTIIAGR